MTDATPYDADGGVPDEQAEANPDSLDDRIAARRADPEFMARLGETSGQNQRALERLADNSDESVALENMLDEGYAALAAAQDDEDRAFHVAVRKRRRAQQTDQ